MPSPADHGRQFRRRLIGIGLLPTPPAARSKEVLATIWSGSSGAVRGGDSQAHLARSDGSAPASGPGIRPSDSVTPLAGSGSEKAGPAMQGLLTAPEKRDTGCVIRSPGECTAATTGQPSDGTQPILRNGPGGVVQGAGSNAQEKIRRFEAAGNPQRERSPPRSKKAGTVDSIQLTPKSPGVRKWNFLHSARHGTGEAVIAGESELTIATNTLEG